MQERDPKAHRFLGLLYEVEENIDKAVECYKVIIRLKYRFCEAETIMNTGCFSRGAGFHSQHPCDVSQPFVIPVQRHLTSSGLPDTCTDVHAG